MLIHDRGASPEEAREYSATWSLQPDDRVAKQIDSQLRSPLAAVPAHLLAGPRARRERTSRGDPERFRALLTARVLPRELAGRLPVRQSVSLVTLGVSDYVRAKAFYDALGWSVTWEAEETAFFQANGVVLVLWSREKLAADMGIRGRGGRLGRHRAGAQRRLARRGARGDRAGQAATARRSRESRRRRSTAATRASSATRTATSGRSRTTRASACATTAASRCPRSQLSGGRM